MGFVCFFTSCRQSEDRDGAVGGGSHDQRASGAGGEEEHPPLGLGRGEEDVSRVAHGRTLNQQAGGSKEGGGQGREEGPGCVVLDGHGWTYYRVQSPAC